MNKCIGQIKVSEIFLTDFKNPLDCHTHALSSGQLEWLESVNLVCEVSVKTGPPHLSLSLSRCCSV